VFSEKNINVQDCRGSGHFPYAFAARRKPTAFLENATRQSPRREVFRIFVHKGRRFVQKMAARMSCGFRTLVYLPQALG